MLTKPKMEKTSGSAVAKPLAAGLILESLIPA
jgi:hypothetical protein